MNRRLALTLWGAALLVMATAGAGVATEIYVQAQNDLQASHDMETDVDIIEDWLDLDIYGEGFQLGLRYSSFSPADPSVSTTGQKASEGITHRFAELQLDDTRLRVGTFTKLFGRGMILRSFENRDLRVDTNLDGLLLEQEGGWWRGSLLTGRVESGQLESAERPRHERFSGADIEVNHGLLTLGGSFLTIDNPDNERHPEAHAIRASLFDGDFSLDWEGARLLHDFPGLDEKGAGQVVEASYMIGPFGFYAAYKHYKNMVVVGSGKLMNQPPVLIHDPRTTLLNRHPHQLNPSDEKGSLVDFSVSTPLGEFLFSRAETRHLDEQLGMNSYEESFVEWDRGELGPFESVHLIVDFQKVPFQAQDQFGDFHWVWDYFVTTGLDLRLPRPVAKGHLVGIWEHQHKSADHVGDYDDELLILEYEHANGMSLSLIGEFVGWTREQQLIEDRFSDDRSIWKGLQIAAPIGDRHNMRLFVGGRREGYICIGGVCRFEPAFDGVELSLNSRF